MLGWIGCGLLFASAAHAADGKLEINQHCATVTGCFAGDTPGFPVATDPGKSYVLTSSLTVAEADTTAINLDAGATLDLNGFSITGPAVCTGTPPSCVGLGNGNGVSLDTGATVRNGRIAGMGGDGIRGTMGKAEELLIEANGDDGIDSSSGGWLISDCRIRRNNGDGIQSATAARQDVIRRNTIYGNGGRGVYALTPLLVDNSIYGNADVGISTGNRAALAYNSLFGNNGGPGNLQISGNFLEIAPNVCDGGACP
jgi:hypothetical protein